MTLYQCPLCKRKGFTLEALTRHLCPATVDVTAKNWSPLQRRRRLQPEEIAAARPVAVPKAYPLERREGGAP